MGAYRKGVIVFGWLKKRPITSNPSQAHAELDDGPFRYDLNGRAIRPSFPGLTDPAKASIAQKHRAVSWAMEWTGNGGMPVTIEAIAAMIDDVLVGRKPKKSDPVAPVLSATLRALSLAAQDNRMARTASAFPWTEFRLGPQEHPCRLALDMSNQLILMAERPIIPLPGCDESECKCWLRQITKAEAAKRKTT